MILDQYRELARQWLSSKQIAANEYNAPAYWQAVDELACGRLFLSVLIIDKEQLEKIQDRNLTHLKRLTNPDAA